MTTNGLPHLTIPGHTWRWHEPQGGQPTSTTCIQLMGATSTLSPVALIKRNNDGTWHAEGRVNGMSGGIAGGYQGALTIEECATAIAEHVAVAEKVNPLPHNPHYISEAAAALKARNAYYRAIQSLADRNRDRAALVNATVEDAHRAVYRTCPNVPRQAADRVAYWELQAETLASEAALSGLRLS